jgi:hypothetical protein
MCTAGTKREHFVKIAYKNHKHSVNNPYSQFRDVYTEEQIASSPVVHEPLTKLQVVCRRVCVFFWEEVVGCMSWRSRACYCACSPRCAHFVRLAW